MTSSPSASAAGAPLRPMTARRRGEAHRVASPLELFFDLCFVVAVAQAGASLVHSVVEGHAGQGVLYYAMVFFAVYWAWVNFSWFASAYDNDDALFRVVTLIQMAGVLVLAAGVSEAFQHHFFVLWLGYLIMRLAMVSQWLRAARGCTGAERAMALRYAIGIALCQVGWLSVLLLTEGQRPWAFAVMALAELCVPVLAERKHPTTWHPHHISERYGLFTIIVLGESIAAATVAVKSAADEHDELGQLIPASIGTLLIVFGAWWIYFAVPTHGRLKGNRQAFLWGYGHYLILGSAAAIGAGAEIFVEHVTGQAHISQLAASASVTVPTAVYLVTVWLLVSRHYKSGVAQQLVLPVTTLVVLVCTLAGRWSVPTAGLALATAVAAGVTLAARAARREPGAAR
ncbi:low temperature requirement protein A [Streptomyces sp. NPDC002490]|uniref:low temperature requirement protein A n=1 Tax=Streptomyces sp. NPDC002490 TaxID=3154416 RepID=UPI003322B91C